MLDPDGFAFTVRPGDGSSIDVWFAEGQGLMRPELAVLLSSAKLVLQDAIGNADVYVSIVSDNNAGTMNGFLILQCAAFQTLNPRQQ